MWWTAIVMGFAGSLHCAGMCSPLAMAITQRNPLVLNKIIYNTGRILTYGLLGAIAASAGSLFIIDPYQEIISFVVGSVFLLLGIGAITGVRVPLLTPAINWFANFLKTKFNFWLKKKSYVAIGVMGMLNGLLPCGLTYLTMAYCFILPTASQGFWYMIVFGLGTWPVMIGVTWVLSIAFGKLKVNYQRITSVVFIIIGIWLFVRVWITHPMDHLSSFGKTTSEEVICP